MSVTSKTSMLHLYVTVFVSGMVTLAVELSASRLLGNVFGSSNLIWANVIGLILLYLTVGHYIGGRWADRSPYPTTLFRIIIWAAFLSGLIPLVARPVLNTAASAVFDAQAALAIGSFVSILVLFSAPITLLGCVSPFVLRLTLTDANRTGQIAGRVSAISTVGSLIGTFLPVLVLIPQVGTFRTFLFFAAILYLTGLYGLQRESKASAIRYLWMPLVIIVLSLLTLTGPLRAAAPGATILYDDESGYNYIQVQEDAAGFRYLYLNEGQGIHSQWHPDYIAFNGTWSYFLTAPYFNNVVFKPVDMEAVAIIGLAGGTIARQHTAVYGAIPIDGIEIDADIIQVGRDYFGMDMPNLTTYAQDGRFVLNRLDRQYTVIAIDAYRPPYIPWHLTTVEFFAEVRNKLTRDGVVAINVGRTDTDRRLVDALTNTLSQVYPSIHAIDVPFSFNTILIATNQPTEAGNLIANLNQLPPDANPLLRDMLTLASNNLVQVHSSDILFTDDHAPVETLVDSLVLNFLLSGGADQLTGTQ